MGMMPVPGDVICSPWVVGGKNRQDPENRTCYEVVQRYFSPQHGDSKKPDDEILVYCCLVISERLRGNGGYASSTFETYGMFQVQVTNE